MSESLEGPDVGVGFRLSPADHDHFVEHGFVAVPGVIPPELIARTVKLLSEEPEYWPGSKEFMAHVPPEELTRALEECAAVAGEVARELLARPGEAPPEVTTLATYFPNPHTPDATRDGPLAPHTDQHHAIFSLEDEKVAAFVYLTEVQARGGAFMFAPDGPRTMRRWQMGHAFESLFYRGARMGLELVEFTAGPGDILIFDQIMWHSPSANTAGPTRYGLRSSVLVPDWQIRPADRPPEELSAVEKTVSMRYLHARHGEEFEPFEVRATDTELEGGLGPVSACDLLRYGGRVYRFWVDPAEPRLVRRAWSTDLGDWTEIAPVARVDEPVVGLATECYLEPTLTVVTRSAEGRSHSLALLGLAPDGDWSRLYELDGCTISRPHHVVAGLRFFTREADGQILYVVSDEAPNEIGCRYNSQPGAELDGGGLVSDSKLAVASGLTDLAAGARVDRVHTAAGPVTDVLVRPLTMAEHVMVADVAGVAHYTRTQLADEFADPLVPLTVEGLDPDEGGPSRVRLFERAGGYWLVTYQIGDRVFWGEIEWRQRPGHIRPLATRADLQHGFSTIGLS